jgi:dihydrofolate reductase
MKNISIIVATDLQLGIGKDNQLLWKIQDDLKRFKKLTTGNVVLMGRKTFESLPKGALPDRENIVLSHQKLSLEGAVSVQSIDEALLALSDSKENFIIGGGEIYTLFFPFARTIYLTQVQHHFEADTFFPAFSKEEWETESTEFIPESDKNQYSHYFQILRRK